MKSNNLLKPTDHSSIGSTITDIGAVQRDVVPRMKSEALLMTLDPAAPLANQLPQSETLVD